MSFGRSIQSMRTFFSLQEVVSYLFVVNSPLAAVAAAKRLQSCPALCDPMTAAHQAPPSLGFSRQEHWNGLPFPFPKHEGEKRKGSHSDSSWPHGPSLPGSSIHGIPQARVLEWVAIAFSIAISTFPSKSNWFSIGYLYTWPILIIYSLIPTVCHVQYIQK